MRCLSAFCLCLENHTEKIIKTKIKPTVKCECGLLYLSNLRHNHKDFTRCFCFSNINYDVYNNWDITHDIALHSISIVFIASGTV